MSDAQRSVAAVQHHCAAMLSCQGWWSPVRLAVATSAVAVFKPATVRCPSARLRHCQRRPLHLAYATDREADIGQPQIFRCKSIVENTCKHPQSSAALSCLSSVDTMFVDTMRSFDVKHSRQQRVLAFHTRANTSPQLSLTSRSRKLAGCTAAMFLSAGEPDARLPCWGPCDLFSSIQKLCWMYECY
jgi:hypothetical protein